MTPVAVMGSKKLPPVTTFDNNNSPDPSMMSGDSCSDSNSLILHSQVIPPSSNSQEDNHEISTTNIASITSPDIVVKDLLSDDNKEPTESESSPKRVKTGWISMWIQIHQF